MIIPVYDKKILTVQLLTVLFFSLALYFFLHFMQEKERFHQELANVAQQRNHLQQIRSSVETYNQVIEKNSVLKNLSVEPTWEQVVFNWKSLAFPELLRRIDNLSYQQKVFVLESFEVGFEKRVDALENTSSAAEGDSVPLEAKERFYRLRGYFLCPCQ